ncbi:hypothetical protein ABT010_40815, partial [Streptomyces sp. NPDC002668]|uniref:hypothetical protein n=1 Tax=Streptomyces sp. NPDC002668 TaxID=3154422 RepID=UPI00332456C3
LSLDPVYGGNANPYEYVHADPLNKYDLDGRRWTPAQSWRKWRGFRRRHAYADFGHSAVMFGIGFTPFRFARTARQMTKWRNVRRSCGGRWGWARCGWGGLALSEGYSTFWYGRNALRHVNRYYVNFKSDLLNSSYPYPRYGYRPWRGHF